MTLLEEYAGTDLFKPKRLSKTTFSRLSAERTRNLLELSAVLQEKTAEDPGLEGKRDILLSIVASRSGKRMQESARRVEKTAESLSRSCRTMKLVAAGLCVLMLIQIVLTLKLLLG